MKKFFILAFILFTNIAYAQKDTIGLNVSFVNGTVGYEKVFDAPKMPKELLYSNAGLWLVETHPYVGNTQLLLENADLSRVVGRVISSNFKPYKVLWQKSYLIYTFNFTLQIDCKDGRYRVRIYNIQDVLRDIYTPMDDLMSALIDAKPYTLANGAVLKVPDMRERFTSLNTVIANVVADISKNITADNSF